MPPEMGTRTGAFAALVEPPQWVTRKRGPAAGGTRWSPGARRSSIAAVALPRLPRRKVLKAALAFGVLGAAGSVIAVARSGGYDVRDEVRVRLVGLEPWQYVVVQHLARRVCASDERGAVSPDETDVAGFVDAYVATMPPRMRRDLGRFLGVIEQLAPVGVGMTSRFTRLGPHDQDEVLGYLESSVSDLVRGGFEGLKSLLFMGYYRDPRTWMMLGYRGPLIDWRP